MSDADTEIYFKAADVVVLPYTHIFQSGVLFLGYNFGLPAIATDIGSLRDDVIEGETGFICKPCDAIDLANCIRKYFSSPFIENWICAGGRSEILRGNDIRGRKSAR